MLKSNLLYNTLTILLLLILCSGCQSFNVGEPYSPEKIGKLNKGIAFLSVSEKGTSLFFQIKKLESPKIVKDRPVRSDTTYSVDSSLMDRGPCYRTKNMLFLDPGLYYIDVIMLKSQTKLDSKLKLNTVYRWLRPPGIIDNTIKYGAFEILQNQVLYIGNLEYAEKINKLVLNTDLKLIDKQLSSHDDYRMLLTNMKIGKFYKSGSTIYLDKKGDYKVLEKDEIDDVTSSSMVEDVAKEIIKKINID
jgi:hypothetical protein